MQKVKFQNIQNWENPQEIAHLCEVLGYHIYAAPVSDKTKLSDIICEIHPYKPIQPIMQVNRRIALFVILIILTFLLKR